MLRQLWPGPTKAAGSIAAGSISAHKTLLARGIRAHRIRAFRIPAASIRVRMTTSGRIAAVLIRRAMVISAPLIKTAILTSAATGTSASRTFHADPMRARPISAYQTYPTCQTATTQKRGCAGWKSGSAGQSDNGPRAAGARSIQLHRSRIGRVPHRGRFHRAPLDRRCSGSRKSACPCEVLGPELKSRKAPITAEELCA